MSDENWEWAERGISPNDNFKPTVITDGGPWATHNMPCAVLNQTEKAVLDMNSNVFQPSWKAQSEGWRLVHARSWFQRFLLKVAGLV